MGGLKCTQMRHVYTSHCVHHSRQSELVALKIPFHKGQRFIIVHTGTDLGRDVVSM